MDLKGSHPESGFDSLDELYGVFPKRGFEGLDLSLLRGQPRKRQRVNSDLEASVPYWNWSGSSAAPFIFPASSKPQGLGSLSLPNGYPREVHPGSLYPSQQTGGTVSLSNEMPEIIPAPEHIQELGLTLTPGYEHQFVTEDDPTLQFPPGSPSIEPGETQFVPLMPDSVPSPTAEPYQDGVFVGTTPAPTILSEPAAYISPYALSTHDAIIGYTAENHSGNFHVSPETIMNNATVDPLLEADSGSLTPCFPGPDQTSPTSESSVCPEEMDGLSLQLDADPCHWTGGALRVPLLTHQKQGIAWMMEMENSDHKGGILADDMGLGKTVQALALIESHPPLSPARRATLVVVPATLIQQWEHEIERLLRSRPGRGRVYTLYGNKRRVGFSELSQYDIVLTSYGVMATELGRKQRGRRWVTSDSNPSGGQTLSILGPTSHWHRVILDEAQSIQNDQSKTAIACRNIDATYRWCLTGTPLTNHLRVLYSLLKFLRLQPCPDFDVFDMVFRRTSDGRECDRDARIALRQSLEAFILRRTWLTLGDDPPLSRLPPCVTKDVYVRLSDMEQVLYIAVERSFQAQFNELQSANLLNRCTSHVHSLLRCLQQACCHPFLVPELPQIISDHRRPNAWLEMNASRFEAGVIHRLRNNNSLRDCPVCFDPVDNPMIFFPCGHSACNPCFIAMFPRTSSPQDSWNARAAMRCPLCRVTVDPALATDYVAFERRHYAPDQGFAEAAGWYKLLGEFLLWVARPANGCIHPTPTASGTDSDLSTWVSSAKVDKALEIVQSVRDQGHGEKILIFSQFTALLDLIEVPLLQRGWIFRRYRRNMTPADRHAAVEAFTNEPDCSLMLVSFGAGYSGLNLTMASQVVIMDPSSDPRVEELAVSRVRRIGQRRPVYVHRILASSMVDDRLMRFLANPHVEINALDGASGRVVTAPGGSDLAYLLQGNQ